MRVQRRRKTREPRAERHHFHPPGRGTDPPQSPPPTPPPQSARPLHRSHALLLSRTHDLHHRLIVPAPGRSHSFRVFVLITSTAPLRLWIWPDSYAMVGPVPYRYLNWASPSASLPSVCAVVINAFFQKRHCHAIFNHTDSSRPDPHKMKFMRLKVESAPRPDRRGERTGGSYPGLRP